MAVKIVVDSAADINLEEAKKLGISMVPMTINFGNEEYLDGITILPELFYQKLTTENVLPKTSQVNEFQFAEEFEKLVQNGDEVVVITISSKLSGTYRSAIQAAEKFANKVWIVDSLNAAIGERLLVLVALDLAKQGKSAKEIADELESKKSKIVLMAVLDTLEYLKKGGRISSAVAFAGTLLSLKPIIAVIEGEVKLVGKSIGSKNAIKHLTKLVAEQGGVKNHLPYGVIYSGSNQDIPKKFIAENIELWNGKPVNYYAIGCTIGTHVGPGAIGLAFFQE